MGDFLKEIVEEKKREVAERKKALSLNELRRSIEREGRDFLSPFKSGKKVIIAEIKRASPSRGIIREGMVSAEMAIEYERAGADAISVLTDKKFFQGNLQDMEETRNAVSLPLLRKDFIIDEYQVYEAKAHGADAYLLISRILDESSLRRLIRLGEELGMVALVEVHSEEDIGISLSAGAKLIGINNRDLSTFNVDVGTTIRLAPLIPEGIYVISESGITEDNIKLLSPLVNGFLIGEYLLRSSSPGEVLRRLKKIINPF